MKRGDIFSRMPAELRLRKVALRQHHFQEVYHTPDELIADLTILIANKDKVNVTCNQIARNLRQVLRTKDEVLLDFSQAFKKFESVYNMTIPDVPIEINEIP